MCVCLCFPNIKRNNFTSKRCNFRGLCEGEDHVLKLALESGSFKVGVKVRVRGFVGMVRVTLCLRKSS